MLSLEEIMSKLSDYVALKRALAIREHCTDNKCSCVSCIFFIKDKGCSVGVPVNWRLRSAKKKNRT